MLEQLSRDHSPIDSHAPQLDEVVDDGRLGGLAHRVELDRPEVLIELGCELHLPLVGIGHGPQPFQDDLGSFLVGQQTAQDRDGEGVCRGVSWLAPFLAVLVLPEYVVDRTSQMLGPDVQIMLCGPDTLVAGQPHDPADIDAIQDGLGQKKVS